ncbi:MAG: hypothetical protein JO081_09530 [Alphaproteobacteria bacterium]|nr:hypothetical protein [Alphaproteobacteria bacterium]
MSGHNPVTSTAAFGGTTGPLLMRALREAQVTALVGVPRLHEALIAAIRLRVDAHGKAVRAAWPILLKTVIVLAQSTGFHLGRPVFASAGRRSFPLNPRDARGTGWR